MTARARLGRALTRAEQLLEERPSGNGRPSPEEREAWKAYLRTVRDVLEGHDPPPRHERDTPLAFRIVDSWPHGDELADALLTVVARFQAL